MKIDIRTVQNKKTGENTFSHTFDFSQVDFGGEFPYQDPVVVSGCVREKLGELHMHLTLDTVLTTACARCLKEIRVPVHIDWDRPLVQKEEDDDEDVVFAPGNSIDLDELVQVELALFIQMVYYCREDCKGLCLNCGADLNEGPCSCGQ